MLTIQRFENNAVCENCYIVSDETREAVIIDCGAYTQHEEQLISQYIENNHLKITHLLCTHAHFDHIFGNSFITQTYQVAPECHPADEQLHMGLADQMRMFMGQNYTKEVPKLGNFLKEGEQISFGNHKFTVIHTPGHTPGGVCFYCREEKVIFTGDSLFQMSIGRTDFPGGSYHDLIESLTKKIMILPDDVTVYPGHGDQTTIGHEKHGNPYLTV